MASGTASRSEDEESLAGQKRSSSQVSGSIPKRRSSSRFIKRKKFDDELVESSLAKSSSRAKGPSGVEPGRCSGSEPSSSEKKKVSKSVSAPVTPSPVPNSSLPKRMKKSKQPLQVTKDLGRWKPADDLLLINAVLQTNDLTSVHLGVKFSCRFTLREIQERWHALLYDPLISKLACQAMRQLHPEAITAIQSKVLFSKAEEQLLSKVGSTSQPTLDTFQDLLHEHPEALHPSRTAKALQVHWQLMKQYYLLDDQTGTARPPHRQPFPRGWARHESLEPGPESPGWAPRARGACADAGTVLSPPPALCFRSVQPLPKGDQVLNFSDAEDMIDDSKLKDVRDEVLEHELTVADRRQKREIRQLEQELHKWQVLVDSITGMSSPDFDNQTLAVLRGRMVRYLMRSREITLGRATKDNQIDVDLALEGPAWKISRKQGVIKLKNNGDFFIANEGRRPIYVDGRPVLGGSKWKLNNNSVVEIASLRFVFLINQDLIALIKAEAAKIPQQ
ncbi:microspherule protein 1 isoform X1 [Chelonia mydas]|uniref:microspherule protein 1 isoform X1 n=1 Tax=Chelonia mydas TaxID=8469 RepID=UPI001CA99F5A|nr:microspherule protein 1 isoform X1 [Chelonia mydas]